MSDDHLRGVIGFELGTLAPDIRLDATKMDGLFDQDFCEIGAQRDGSGFEREARGPGRGGRRAAANRCSRNGGTGRQLRPRACCLRLVKTRAPGAPKPLWRLSGGSWRFVFH